MICAGLRSFLLSHCLPAAVKDSERRCNHLSVIYGIFFFFYLFTFIVVILLLIFFYTSFFCRNPIGFLVFVDAFYFFSTPFKWVLYVNNSIRVYFRAVLADRVGTAYVPHINNDNSFIKRDLFGVRLFLTFSTAKHSVYLTELNLIFLHFS